MLSLPRRPLFALAPIVVTCAAIGVGCGSEPESESNATIRGAEFRAKQLADCRTQTQATKDQCGCVVDRLIDVQGTDRRMLAFLEAVNRGEDEAAQQFEAALAGCREAGRDPDTHGEARAATLLGYALSLSALAREMASDNARVKTLAEQVDVTDRYRHRFAELDPAPEAQVEHAEVLRKLAELEGAMRSALDASRADDGPATDRANVKLRTLDHQITGLVNRVLRRAHPG